MSVESAGSAVSWDANHHIWNRWRAVAVFRRIEDQPCIGVDDAGVVHPARFTDKVAQESRARLRGFENCTQIGQVAFHMPGRAERCTRLSRSTEVNVRATEEELGGAVELTVRLSR